jgi:hypothetical protein
VLRGNGVVMRAFDGSGVVMRAFGCGAFVFTWLAGGEDEGARSGPAGGSVEAGVTRVPERSSAGTSLGRSPSPHSGADAS